MEFSGETPARPALIRTTKVQRNVVVLQVGWHDTEKAVAIQTSGLKWYSKVNNTRL